MLSWFINSEPDHYHFGIVDWVMDCPVRLCFIPEKTCENNSKVLWIKCCRYMIFDMIYRLSAMIYKLSEFLVVF